MGLGMNAKKTKCMVFKEKPTEIYTKDGSKLDIVKDFMQIPGISNLRNEHQIQKDIGMESP